MTHRWALGSPDNGKWPVNWRELMDGEASSTGNAWVHHAVELTLRKIAFPKQEIWSTDPVAQSVSQQKTILASVADPSPRAELPPLNVRFLSIAIYRNSMMRGTARNWGCAYQVQDRGSCTKICMISYCVCLEIHKSRSVSSLKGTDIIGVSVDFGR